MRKYSLKEKLGCLLIDLPRLLPSLFLPNRWINACNRNENLKVTDGGVDTRILGPHSIDLYAAHVFPWIGLKLMRCALFCNPIDLGEEGYTQAYNDQPEVSFIVGHRGRERLPLLLLVLQSIAKQRGASVECIVVEESDEIEVRDDLPSWVRYIHLPTLAKGQPYNRSRTFNTGAQVVRSAIVVSHDSDILVPCSYAREIIRHIRYNRYEVVYLCVFFSH